MDTWIPRCRNGVQIVKNSMRHQEKAIQSDKKKWNYSPPQSRAGKYQNRRRAEISEKLELATLVMSLPEAIDRLWVIKFPLS